jgi:hypothetical protein
VIVNIDRPTAVNEGTRDEPAPFNVEEITRTPTVGNQFYSKHCEGGRSAFPTIATDNLMISRQRRLRHRHVSRKLAVRTHVGVTDFLTVPKHVNLTIISTGTVPAAHNVEKRAGATFIRV